MDGFQGLQCKVEIKNEPHIDEYLKQLDNSKKRNVVHCTDLRLKLQKKRIQQSNNQSSELSIKIEPLEIQNVDLFSNNKKTINKPIQYTPVVKDNSSVTITQNKMCFPAKPTYIPEREAPSLENMLTEDELLADTDTLSVITDCLNEDELLNEDDVESHSFSPENRNKNKLTNDSKVPSPTEKSYFNDDIFDTMSIAATENEFNEEIPVEKPSKKRTSSELTTDLPPKSKQSVSEKINEWQKSQFKIPRIDHKAMNPNTSRRIPDTQSHFKAFHRGILSVPQNQPNKTNSEEKDLRSFISQSKPKGSCFRFLKTGSCTQDGCRYSHDTQDNKRQHQHEPPSNEFRKHQHEPLPNNEFRKHQHEPPPNNEFRKHQHEPPPNNEFRKHQHEPPPNNEFRKHQHEPPPNNDFRKHQHEPPPNNDFRKHQHEPPPNNDFRKHQHEPLPNNEFRKQQHEPLQPVRNDYRPQIEESGFSNTVKRLTDMNVTMSKIMEQNRAQVASATLQPPQPIINTRNSFPPTNFQTPSSSISQTSHMPMNAPGAGLLNAVRPLPPLPMAIQTNPLNKPSQDQSVRRPNDIRMPIFQKPKDPTGPMINQAKLNSQTTTHFQITPSTRRDTPGSYGNLPFNEDFRNNTLDELMELFERSNNIEQKWSIMQRLNDSSLGPDRHQCHLIAMEKLLLLLRENGSQRSLEIARKIFVIKHQMNCLKAPDLYILAELECKQNNINKAIEHLTEYKTKFGRIDGVKSGDNEELLFHAIEPSAKITKFWEDFRITALQSDRVLDRMLCTFNEVKLTELFTIDDINMIYKKMMEIANIKISPSSKTTILYLLSTTENISQMINYIDKHSDSILHITHTTAQKILELIPNLPNIIDCLPSLRKLTKLVDPNIWNTEPFPKTWNQLLSYAYRKDLVQFSEQIYGIMEEVKVKPTVECSMKMLSGLCKNRFFQVFEKRCHDLYSMEVFPEDFKYPTSFAQEISDALQEYDCEDKNIVHHMIRFLISSDCPPTENNITDVLNMLISKRRFSDVYSLILECFDANIILSQKDLRRAIFALEEWMQNVEASIHVYKNMRQFYRRPEHQCICGSESKAQLLPMRQLSTGELASPKSSNGSNQESSSENTDASRNSTNRLLSRISAELNAFSKDISKFTDTYEQAYNNGYGNHEKVLVGLFLGLTETDKPDAFQQFVVQLFAKFEEVPSDVEKALGRVGLRLIKRFYERNLWDEAVETIEVFHSYSIRYANATEGFGTQMQTKDALTSCEIADLCCRCCIYAKKPFTACASFSHCDHCITKEELTIPENKILASLVSDLVTALNTDYPEKTIAILASTHQNLGSENLKVMLNKVLQSLVNTRNLKPGDIAKDIEQLTPMFEHKSEFLQPKTTKDLVYFYVTYNQWANARRFFEEGRAVGVYTETFYDTQPFLAEIKTGLTAGEIYLTIESHLIRLINHPVYCIGKQLTQPVDLVVAPGTDLDGEEFQFGLHKTMRVLGRVLTQEFAPPLQILETENQKYMVCPRSISEWYAQRSERKNRKDTDRYLNHKSNKRSVNIQSGGSQSDLKIKFCPTPVPSDQGSVVNSESSVPVVNTSVNDSSGEKRLLKSFRHTNNPIEAANYCRKIVCAHLNRKYLKNGLIGREEFKIIAKELSEAFTDDIKKHKGYVYYDKYVHDRALEYVDCYFNNQNNVTMETRNENTAITDY